MLKILIDKIYILTVVILILAFSINNITKIIPDTFSSEKRTLKVCPSLERKADIGFVDYLKNLTQFPKEYDSCFNDNFSFRNYAVQFLNYIRLTTFDISSMSNVSKGKDGWFFYNDLSIQQAYNGSIAFSEQDLENWKKVLEKRQLFLKDIGVDYIVMIVPNKLTAYSQFLPDSLLAKENKKTRLDDITEYLSKFSKLKFINIKTDITKQKNDQSLLYYKTDSHWNQNGVWLGYKAIMDSMPSNIKFHKYTEQDYELQNRKHIGDLALLQGVGEFVYDIDSPNYVLKKGENFKKVQSEGVFFADSEVGKVEGYNYVNNNSDLSKALLFGDSYTDELRPFLARSFGELDFLKTVEKFDYSAVNKYKPNVVI